MTEYRHESEMSHSGATGGYRTYLARWPARRLSLALLCNVGNANTIALGHQVADVFIGPRVADQVTVRVADTGQATFTAPAADLAGFTGSYYSPELDVAYHLSVASAGLTAQFGERAPITFRPIGPDRFSGPQGLNVRFFRAKNGRTVGFVLGAERVQNLRFVRREP